LQIKRDKYDVDKEGGGQVTAGEFDSEYDAGSNQASLVSLLAKSDRDSSKLYDTT
jgi:hypothetical protein